MEQATCWRQGHSNIRRWEEVPRVVPAMLVPGPTSNGLRWSAQAPIPVPTPRPMSPSSLQHAREEVGRPDKGPRPGEEMPKPRFSQEQVVFRN